ncbi:hypothetical protein JRO89_XS06G0102400 [Xanthoceras sorbifolium]|uniref:Uncharacterized protein n=1 Tax=Xanthoceras sorbifolium TaxID=99658 RepID=A0ABQ8HXJ2_9ROSI|nr:hypothetical protein JRO89_XS06G0102400 [Xanthoceras sorbifolium]
MLAGGGRDVAAALKEAVDPVGVLPYGGAGESMAAVGGVGGKRREETIEVGLESAVSREGLDITREGVAWKTGSKGQLLNVMDSTLSVGSSSEIQICIHIELLLAQENVVVLMLTSSSVSLLVPSKPAFFYAFYHRA